MEALILIPPNWYLEFHVHTNASLLVIGAILAQNLISKYDQFIVYASRLLNKIEHNYTTTNRKTLAMVMFYISSNIFCWETNLSFMCRPHGFGIFGQ